MMKGYTFLHYSLLATVVALMLVWSAGCNQFMTPETTTPKRLKGNIDLLNVGTGNYDGGQWYAHETEEWWNHGEDVPTGEGAALDSILLAIRHRKYTGVTAYFGRACSITGASVNGHTLGVYGGGGEYSYQAFDMPLYFGTQLNTFEWTIDGTTYTHTISLNTPQVNIEQPELMDTLNRSDNVTIAWTPSPDSTDYVMITVLVLATLDGSLGRGITEIVADDGFYTVPSSVLRNARKISIRLARGVAEEAYYGGKKYLFVLAKSSSIECMVR